MKTNFLIMLLIIFHSYAWADYEVSSWRCGAPLVEALRIKDPKKILDDPDGKLQLMESLRKISQSNLDRLIKSLNDLSDKEQSLHDLIINKFRAPIIHRTSPDSTKFILTTPNGLVSATKRKVIPRTPKVEEYLFSAFDCIFVSVGPPFGTERYGTTIIRLKPDEAFGWATLWSGYHWLNDSIKADLTGRITKDMKIKFAEQIFTDNHWDKAMALHIIGNIRNRTSYRGQGKPYDSKTILDELLTKTTSQDFWYKINKHRLAYLEGKYMDNVGVGLLSYVQFRSADKPLVQSWGLPPEWTSGNPDSFIQYFDRDL